MREHIAERVYQVGEYTVKNNSTVRDTAQHFGVGKSTIHLDITTRLKEVNPILYYEAMAVIDVNKEERHSRGGIANREMHKEKRMIENIKLDKVS